MTELALSGLAMPLSGGYINPPGNRRSQQTNTETAETREPGRESPRDSERVVTGEVLSASENTYSYLNNTQSRSSQRNSDTSASSGQARRFNLQAAIQTFRDNEAIVVDQRRTVQVSGIIDVYA
jgi:SLT domain-containing protein